MKFNENSAVTMLRGNGIKFNNKIILVPKQGVGLKCWSAIDYLCNRMKYNWTKI